MSMDDQNITRISPPPFGAPKRTKQPSIIEESLEVTRQLQAQGNAASHPPPAPKPTYKSCVADSIDSCRYLDVKGMAQEIMGDKEIKTPADLADLMAEWAAKNKTEVAA